MNVSNLLKRFHALPPTTQGLVILTLIALLIYVGLHHEIVSNITNLIQSFPPIFFFQVGSSPDANSQSQMSEPSNN